MRPRWLIPVVALVFCASLLAAQQPRNARETRILQIQQAIEQHDLPEAQRLLEQAEAQFPDDAGLDNLRGVIAAQQGNYAAAETAFMRAVRRSRRFTAAYLNLGRLYQENPGLDPEANNKALQVYQRVLEYEPQNEEGNYQIAALLLKAEKYQESADHIGRLSNDVQNRPQASSIACADFAGLGSRTRADDRAARLLKNSDFTQEDAQEMLPALQIGKRDDLVILLLENLQARQALPPQLLQSLGLAYQRTHNLTAARAALEKLASSGNLSVALLLQLAQVAREQQDYKGSLGYVAHAQDLEPNNASIRYYFGLVCIDLNLLAEAGGAFDKAVKLEPENPTYNYAMGAVASFLHDPGEAIPFFQKYLKLKPEDPRAKLALGTAYFRAKDYDAAVPWLTEAVAIPETSTAAHYYLGSIALQQRRLDDALHHLQLALKANPDHSTALAELGQYYLITKNYAEAEKQIRHALTLDPDQLAANLYLVTLYSRTGDPRREEQAKHFEDLQKRRDEKAQEVMRIVEVRPFDTP